MAYYSEIMNAADEAALSGSARACAAADAWAHYGETLQEEMALAGFVVDAGAIEDLFACFADIERATRNSPLRKVKP